jgi:hypothetical protein
MGNTSVAFGLDDDWDKVTLGYNTDRASGWTTGEDRARRRVRSWQGSSMAAASPSLKKADHVCMKWDALVPSMAAWLLAVPNATPPHFKNVTCNLPHIMYV